jgi:hypothetical protein
MIDPNKSLVIFSHPRSGSTWFQNSLKQYSLGELFNLNIELVSYDNDNIHFKFDKHGYDLSTAQQELQKRFDIFNHFESTKGAVSVKIHTSILNDQMIEFLKTKNIQMVSLERLSKSDTFWSFLIGWNLNNWHDKIEPQSIAITQRSFERVLAVMSKIESSSILVTETFSANKIYYEDLVGMPNNEWFTNSSKYKVVDGKSVVTITNLIEVNDWLTQAGYSEWTRP